MRRPPSDPSSERILKLRISMTLHFNPPPRKVCLLRLSAIGDTCHALAVLRALQTAWPQTQFTWIIGTLEAKLMTALVPEIEFITFDKRRACAEALRLRRVLAGRDFDLLLHMQLSLRASLLSRQVHAPIKLGFDRARARELQGWFTNAQIAPARREHVLDSLMGFVRACGVEPGTPEWHLSAPLAGAAEPPILVISPCSSHRTRNWSALRYAAVAEHAMNTHGMQVILAGGPSPLEIQMGGAITQATGTPRATGASLINRIGSDSLPQLLQLLARSTVLLSPDSGPVHMASMVGLPVIGLYAATNSERSGPYFSRPWCVDKYALAARKFLGKSAASLPWTTKIERPGVMDLISVADVTDRLDQLMRERRSLPNPHGAEI